MLRFQHRLSIFPGVRLNFSCSGVSATIGVPGASLTIGGPNGPTANLGLPGTGLSVRVPLNGQKYAPDVPSQSPPPPAGFPNRWAQGSAALAFEAVQSKEIDVLTSKNLVELRDLLANARIERASAEKAVAEAINLLGEAEQKFDYTKQRHEDAETQLARDKASWLRLFSKRRIITSETRLEQRLRDLTAATERREAARESKQQQEQAREALYVATDIKLTPSAEAAWRALSEAFVNLSRSVRIWDITRRLEKQRGAQRSVATESVERKPTRLSPSSLPIIESPIQPLQWHNANGGDLYLYPGLLVVFQNADQFALLDLMEVNVEFEGVQFHEDETTPPSDAMRVGTTWTYTNKNGTPDRRFAHNPEIPIMRYGRVHWKSPSGLSEAFLFSNADAVAKFADALADLRRTLAAN